jgi:hypothetical protein
MLHAPNKTFDNLENPFLSTVTIVINPTKPKATLIPKSESQKQRFFQQLIMKTRIFSNYQNRVEKRR